MKIKSVKMQSPTIERNIKTKKKVVNNVKNTHKKEKKIKKNNDNNEANIDGTNIETSHKKSLKKLKNIDPEFYKFLEKNDTKLLEFNVDNIVDDDDDDDDDADVAGEDYKNRGDDKSKIDEDTNSDDENIHKPSDELDVASDDSDFELDDNVSKGDDFINLKLLKQWQIELNQDKIQLNTIKNCIDAFHSALLSISSLSSVATTKTATTGKGKNYNKKQIGKYKVEGSSIFNGVVQLCILNIQPALKRYLGIKKPSASTTPQRMTLIHKCKKWSRIKSSLRIYLIDLIKLLENVTSVNILIILLKHLHQMSDMLQSFSNIIKPILKRLVIFWSTGTDETIRVLSFLCILKITRSQQQLLLSTILKAMYLSYIRNSKFVSPNTLPAINFMRRSLSEMFLLDLNVSYQHVFLYIRQLAIHLRNAITLKKKESYQSVYNWQFINSLRLWAELLGSTTINNTTGSTSGGGGGAKSQLQPLLYPLINIIIGVIKLIPTAQCFPLRLHCTQILIMLTKQTGQFIPILPFLLEILQSSVFNQKHTKISMKPLKFTFILRLNKQQLAENGFRDEIIEIFQEQTLDLMSYESNRICYPELIIPFIINLKKILKSKCKNINYSRKLKILCDRLEENLYFIEKQREQYPFTAGTSLNDVKLIHAWETNLLNNKNSSGGGGSGGTPLLTYYNDWIKTHVKLRKRVEMDINNENDEYKLPTINRNLKRNRADDNNDGKPVELFPSDDEMDGDGSGAAKILDIEKPIRKKINKKKQQNVVMQTENDDVDDVEDDFTDGGDILKDFDLEDW